MLPEPVLAQARKELLDWQGTGMSVMEISHRSKEFMSVAEQAESDLRELLQIPDTYSVLFLHGGASSQYAMVPLNLLSGRRRADYINTGAWSKKAIVEAGRFCDVNIAASSEAENFTTIPNRESWCLDPDAAYVHYTPNETIGGVEFHWVPDTADVPLVADCSSTMLSRPIDVSKYGVLYAGAQKNIGPAGLAIVIVRQDLIGKPLQGTPAMFDYQVHHDSRSMYNTPPTFAWYLSGLVFKWLKNSGGLSVMAERNYRKAHKLYKCIDESGFYRNPVVAECRSWMNVPFTLADPSLDKMFLEQAAAAGLAALKGHRSVGGMRASMYNAMPEEGVDALIAFMAKFERQYG